MRTAFLATLLLWIPLLSQATTFYERPFPETVQESPTIVRGTIGSSYADWGKAEDGSKRIYTYFELAVSEVFKGQVDGRSVLVRQMGGEKDGLGLQIAGSASFNRGEDVVVLLGDKTPDGSYEIRGLSSGKMIIERDDDGNEALVGGAIPGAGGHGHEHEHGTGGHADSGGQERWTLDDLRRVVREQAQSKLVKNPEPVNSVTPVVTHQVNVNQPAPQLQPTPSREAEATSSGSPAWAGMVLKGLGAVLLLGGAGWMVWRRK